MSALRPDGKVPFVDLAPMNGAVGAAVLADIEALIASGAFVNGPQVKEFENAFATYCGVAWCVGVASGLDALRLALVALGVGAGDEVLVPAMTFVATFEAVTQAGAVPVPVDVSEDACIDVDACAASVGPRTAAILPVHLYGRLADMQRLTDLADAKELIVLEDACQAHGATRDGVRAGTAGAAAAFSFYPAKNLGAFGDAGALVTEDAAVAADVRALREHGQGRKYEHDAIGWTARLDTLQAAVLLHKLPLLDAWNEQRRALASAYDDGLAGVGDLVLPDASDAGQVWHLYVVRTGDPAGLAAHLASRGVASGRHYPEAPHLSKAYQHLGYPAGTFPVAERFASQGLSLPLFPGMSTAQLERVVAGVRSWFDGG